MRNIEVKEDGSMWKLATLWGNEYLPKDGCMLVWKTLFHTLILSVVCVVSGLFLGDLIASLAASITMGTWIWGKSIIIITWFIGILVGMCLLALPFIMWEDSDEDSKNPVMKSIYNIKTIKQSWKEKWCPVVVEIEKYTP